MSSSYPIKSTLEKLPDELLLLVCRYLSSTDVLFSFYGLNSRLSRTISGYSRHVVIAEIPYKQFTHVCTSILPEIGSNIISLVVSNQWKGILSKLFTNYFGERMSLIFPHLKQITFISFNDHSLKSFLDGLQSLPELHQINICYMHPTATSPVESGTLLHRIFTANNNQLNSILFDEDSIVFSFKDKNNDIFYVNIQKLSIDLKTINDLHRLLTLLPRLISLNVTINNDSLETDTIDDNTPIVTLKEFQLQSFGPLWNLDELTSILIRLPNVEELSITIETVDDTRLIDGEMFFSLFPTLSVKKFNYFLRFYDTTSSIDHTKIVSTWQQFTHEFICIKSDNNEILALYTLPFVFSYLVLPSSLAKNEVFSETYAPQVKNLILYDASAYIVDTFSVIKKCRRIQNLNLRIDENIVPQFSKEIRLRKLPYLTEITTLSKSVADMEHFQRLLEVSPNLHNLEVNYEFLRPLFDIESVCLLLRHRITHLYILIIKTTDLEPVISSISRFTSIFPFLKHFYFSLEKSDESTESLILGVLNCLSEWSSLVSFGVVGAVLTQETISKDIRQWVVENSNLHEQNSFVVDYTDNRFRLWL